jgi:hypothetical protein
MPEVIIGEPSQKIQPLGEQNAPATSNRRARHLVAWACAAFALYTAIAPVGRACMLLQVTYNEGWNVYNAQTVAEHRLLYPASPGWTVVNYPALSFFIAAGLSKLTHDFLFTARAISVLSTVLCGLFVGLIVRQMMARQLTHGRWPALIAGLYCFALFCAGANTYVGVDDPQMFAQVFLMAGLFLYVRYRENFWALVVTALLLVIGANIKHILIEFPLAIFIDLLIVSRRKALQFGLVGAALAALSVLLNIHFGGPGFLAAMFAPRIYSFQQLLDNLSSMYVPIVLASLIAAAMAFRFRNNPSRRILSILFATSWLTAIAFGGGVGVTINVLFGGVLAHAMLLGLFFEDLQLEDHQADVTWPRWLQKTFHQPWAGTLAAAVPLLLLAWLIIPLADTGSWRPVRALIEDRAAQQRFQEETNLLAAKPGNALCESLLRCYYAHKPYVYDPFNATRLIALGKLDPQVIASQLKRREFGAVQLERPVRVQYGNDVGKSRFAPTILRAVEEYYAPMFENEDGVIYVPKRAYSSTDTLLGK